MPIDISNFAKDDSANTGVNDSSAAWTLLLTPAPSGGDDQPALQAFLNAAPANSTVRLRAGQTYLVNESLIRPQNVSIDGAGSTIRAGAPIAGPVIDTPQSLRDTDRGIYDLVIDCNNLAQNGYFARYFADSTIRDVKVLNPTQHGVILGDTGAPTNSYGMHYYNLRVIRTDSTVPSGYYGLWISNASDGRGFGGIFMAQTGIRCDGGDWAFYTAHAWAGSSVAGALIATCFDDNANGNEWHGCVADTPTTIGFRLRGQNSRIIGGLTYVNSIYGVDNVVTAVQVDTASAFYSVVAHRFQGADVTHRIASDFGGSGALGTGNTNATSYANQRTNVVTVNPDQVGPNNLRGLTIIGGNPGSQSQRFTVANNTTGNASLVNGANLQGYKNNFTTQTTNIDASSGAIQPGNTSGLGARQFSGSGAPTTPGGAITYVIGDLYWRTDGGVGTTLYRCTTGGASPVWTAIL